MQEVSVNVSPTNTVMVDLDVDRALIRDGEQVTLTWQTDNADSCVAEGSWGGAISHSINLPVGNYYVAMTVIGTDGESEMSGEVRLTSS